MALTPIILPPGVWRNGTGYQAKGRWYDANLVRFFDKTVRPIGGWASFTTNLVTTGKARAMISWIDSAGSVWIVIGTETKLYVFDLSGSRNDITPAGLAAGYADATFAAGYGAGTFGTSTYGTTRGGSTILIPATIWTFDVLEQYLVATNTADGKIYKWDLVTADVAAQCAGSPSHAKAVMVTQEGFIFALGADVGGVADARSVQWPDQSSFTDWTASDINMARSYSLQSTGEIMCGRRIKDASLIFTTTDVHQAVFVGLPDVYSFTAIGQNCGIISQQAHAAGEGFCAWMGPTGFWKYDGVVSAVECDVADYLFSRLNQAQASKVYATHNATYGEIWWYYPSTSGTEIDSYVVWNYREGHWNKGALARLCATEANVLSAPLMVDASGQIWTHETGNSYNSEGTPYAETGPLEMGAGYLSQEIGGVEAGEHVYDIVGMIPDSSTTADVTITFYGRFYPTGTETTSSAYTQANPTDIRVSGRQFRMRATSASASDWRFGVPRLDVRLSGLR